MQSNVSMERAKTANVMNLQRVESENDGKRHRLVSGSRGRGLDPLETLKSRLLAEQLAVVRDSELEIRLRWAAEESASIAWATAYPLLALPELLREKTAQAFVQYERQRLIQLRGRLTSRLAA